MDLTLNIFRDIHGFPQQLGEEIFIGGHLWIAVATLILFGSYLDFDYVSVSHRYHQGFYLWHQLNMRIGGLFTEVQAITPKIVA